MPVITRSGYWNENTGGPYTEALTRKEGRTVQLTPIWEPGPATPRTPGPPAADGVFEMEVTERGVRS